MSKFNTTTRFLLPAAMAIGVATSAQAASPYDSAYGLQWNFVVGQDSKNNNSEDIAVAADGTVYVMGREYNSDTWGTGQGQGGFGAISSNGVQLFGGAIQNLPNYTGGQTYVAGVTTIGNEAYFGISAATTNNGWTSIEDPNNPGTFLPEDGPLKKTTAGIFSLNSGGYSTLANQRTLTNYKSDGVTLRTDIFAPTGFNGEVAGTQFRPNDSASWVNGSGQVEMIVVGDGVQDLNNIGDYGGALSYMPTISRVNTVTGAMSGPTTRPIVSGAPTAGDNHTYFTKAAVDQNSGWMYGGGYHRRATPTAFDPDGAGSLSSIALSGANLGGIGVAYDTNNVAQYGFAWTGTGFNFVNTVASTNDGTNRAVWGGEKEDQAYVEIRDNAGAVVWSLTKDLSPDTVSTGTERVSAVEIDSQGDLIITAYYDATAGDSSTRNAYVAKYAESATGANDWTLVWERSMDAGAGYGDGTNELSRDVAIDANGDTIFHLSQAYGDINNITGKTYVGNGTSNNLHLVQKLSAGDFNGDGFVNYADVEIASAAIAGAGGSLGAVDTYDFDRDGDSDAADGIYFVTSVLDRLQGDVEGNDLFANPNTDVDNADIGVVAGNFNGAGGSGKTFATGDVDFDGDVDNADIGVVAGGFTGALAGNLTDSGNIADLRYDPTTGNITLDASEAAGAVITSFQLENGTNAFIAGNYNSLVGGTFGGAFEDVSDSVAADSDLTFVGLGGLLDLGNIAPTGLDLAQLEALLTNAVYVGSLGSGNQTFDLVVIPEPTSLALLALGGLFMSRRRRG